MGVGESGGEGASNSDRLMSQMGRRFSFCDALRALSGLEFTWNKYGIVHLVFELLF